MHTELAYEKLFNYLISIQFIECFGIDIRKRKGRNSLFFITIILSKHTVLIIDSYKFDITLSC